MLTCTAYAALPSASCHRLSTHTLCQCAGPFDGSMSSASGRLDAQRMEASSPHLDIFEPRPVLSGGLEAVLGQEAESLGSMSGQAELTPHVQGL